MSVRTPLIFAALMAGLVAIGFGLTALFLALAANYGAIAAAGVLSIALLTLAGFAILAERIIARRQAEQEPATPVEALRHAVRTNPVGTVGAIAGLSFIVMRQPALAARAARHIATLLV